MRGDVALGRVRTWVAAHGHIGVVFVLIHAHVADEELGRKGFAEAWVEATLATVSLAVILRIKKKMRMRDKKKKKQSDTDKSHNMKIRSA